MGSRQGPADRKCYDTGRSGRFEYCATAPEHLAARRIRRYRSVAGSSRHLRSAVFCRDAANAGDWCTYRAGATAQDVLRMVLTTGGGLFLMGAAIGLVAAVVMSRLVSHLLFEVSPGDPVSYVSVVVVFAAIALLACYIPARRAAKVDPMVALRYE